MCVDIYLDVCVIAYHLLLFEKVGKFGNFCFGLVNTTGYSCAVVWSMSVQWCGQCQYEYRYQPTPVPVSIASACVPASITISVF